MCGECNNVRYNSGIYVSKFGCKCNIQGKCIRNVKFNNYISQSKDTNTTLKRDCCDITDECDNNNINKACNDNCPVSTDNKFELKNKGVYIANLNVHHLLPKLEEIKLYLRQSVKPHIIGFCETFLQNDIDNERLNIQNYIFERKDRINKQGGGLIVYLCENISYTRRYDLECNNIESIWVQINQSRKKRFLLNFVYRPPSSNQAWIELYEAQIELADKLNIDFYLLGDFNIQYYPTSSQSKYSNSKWADLVAKFGLHQLVQSPTRVAKYSSSIIDHIYTNNLDYVLEVNVPSISISDHYPTCLTRSNTVKVCQNKFAEHKTIKYRSFKKFNETNFQRDLANSNVDNVETIFDPNIALNALYNVLNNILSHHAPIKEKRIKREHQPEWFTDELKSLMHKRDNYHRNRDIDQYKILRNKITYLIKKNKKYFFNKAVNKNKDPKYLWKHLKDISFSGKVNKLVLPQRISINETVVEGEINIINELNKHFVNISNIITKTKFANENFLMLKQVLHEKLRSKNLTSNTSRLWK